MVNDPIVNLIKAIYKKDGCKYAFSCATCPFPICEADLKRGQKMPAFYRARLTKSLFKKGVSYTFLMELFNTTRASIYGYLKERK